MRDAGRVDHLAAERMAGCHRLRTAHDKGEAGRFRAILCRLRRGVAQADQRRAVAFAIGLHLPPAFLDRVIEGRARTHQQAFGFREVDLDIGAGRRARGAGDGGAGQSIGVHQSSAERAVPSATTART